MSSDYSLYLVFAKSCLESSSDSAVRHSVYLGLCHSMLLLWYVKAYLKNQRLYLWTFICFLFEDNYEWQIGQYVEGKCGFLYCIILSARAD